MRSQVEIGESSGTKPRVTTRILLNKWQHQQEKERYQEQRYEEEKRRFERKRTGESKNNMHENRSVRIGGVRFSGTAGMRV
jgi:hypothetical protein